MTYEISGEDALAEETPTGAFQRALEAEMEGMRKAIIANLTQPMALIQWMDTPEFRAEAEQRKAERRARRVEKWGERRVNNRGIGLRIARTWEGPRLTTLPEEETDPW